MEVLDIINKRDVAALKNYYYENGFLKTTELLGPYISRENYIKLTLNGEVIKRSLNNAIPFLTILKNISKKEIAEKEKIEDYILAQLLNHNIWRDERRELKKIDRMTKERVEDIEDNYFKVLYKSEKAHALRYGQEFLLRDREGFYKLTAFFALISAGAEYIAMKRVYLVEKCFELIKILGERENYFVPLFCAINSLTTYSGTSYYQRAAELVEANTESNVIGIEEIIKNRNIQGALLYINIYGASKSVEELSNCLKANDNSELSENMVAYLLYISTLKGFVDRYKFEAESTIALMAFMILFDLNTREEIVRKPADKDDLFLLMNEK